MLDSTNSAVSTTRIWTPANVITLVRICLVPVFVVALLSPWPEWFGIAHLIDDQAKSLIAAGVFILISCTDWVDGYLARKRHEVTDFGKFMDPLADKILVAAALLALVELQVLPAWPVLIILTREFIVSGVRMIAASKSEVIAASWYGKAKTVAQIVAIVLFLVKDTLVFPNAENVHSPLYIVSWLVMLIALALTIISMLDYISKARHLLGFKPSSHQGDSCGAVGRKVPSDSELESLAGQVVQMAIDRGVSLSTAESLTGGMVSWLLTSVPGSSSVVRGGVASYAMSAKSGVLGVDAGMLEECGAVNAQTAMQMASGSCKAFNTDIAVSTTGIAGPTGAEPGKPVGTVWIGLSYAGSDVAQVFDFAGDRDAIRRLSSQMALQVMLDAVKQGTC